MSKCLIQTRNTATSEVNAGGTIPLGGIARRYGCVSLNGNNVMLNDKGYYLIDVYGTYTGTAGNVQVDIVQDGNVIATATETIATASTQVKDFAIPTTARVYCCVGSQISAVVNTASTSTPTFSEFGVRVVKV